MAELHLIGQLLSASDFAETQLFCRWSVQFGGHWQALEGACDGQTGTSSARLGGDSAIAFSHPIDVHLGSRGIQGWPKLHVEVYAVNALGRYRPVGFGVAHVPARPGVHRVPVVTWRIAADSWLGGWRQRFGAGGIAVSKADLVYSGRERYKLETVSAGRVHFELLVVARGFARFGVELC